MWRWRFLIAFICLVMSMQGCSDRSSSPSAARPTKDVQLSQAEMNLAESSNTFGFKLFRQVVASESKENVFISPLSVSLALGMTLNGAGGSTYDSMQAALELAGMSADEINQNYRGLIDFLSALDPKVKFQIANSIWTSSDFTVKREFYEVNKTYFDAETRSLDFRDSEAVDVINGWVDEKTNGKIDRIIEEIPEYVIMYLINAIYFNGIWTNGFDTLDTKPDQFWLMDESKVDCSMMERADAEVPYFGSDDLQVIELTYGGGDYSMIILLPRRGINPDALIGSLTDDSWKSIYSSMETTKVDVRIPRFRVEYDITLNDVLSAMGMAIAFDDLSADFSGICDGIQLCITEVKHKTYVAVNEMGTEAAAVTSVGIGFTSIDPTVNSFIADHPFAFVIAERKSGTMLFMGKVGKAEFE